MRPLTAVIDTVICGDALETLRGLPEGCVDLCVTSPPYWGLRDYGTAEWEDGDAACDHSPARANGAESSTLGGGQATNGHKQEAYRGTCAKCGARRIDQQMGLEPTLAEYVAVMAAVFEEVRRVLKPTGSLYLNLGDSYASSWACSRRNVVGAGSPEDAPRPSRIGDGLKEKDLCGVPWRVAFALQDAGWWLREDIIWAKPNPMPESVADRCTRSHEYLFHLTKQARYWYDADAIREPHSPDGRKATTAKIGNASHANYRGGDGHERWPNDGRNRRSVWTINTHPFPDAHFATFPPALVRPCIRAACPPGGVVLDPFLGSGTVGLVAKQEGRSYIGIELNPEYMMMAERRISNAQRPLEVLA